VALAIPVLVFATQRGSDGYTGNVYSASGCCFEIGCPAFDTSQPWNADIVAVQKAVAQWFLQNQPENAWQLNSILAQIELNWFPADFSERYNSRPADTPFFTNIEGVSYYNVPRHSCCQHNILEPATFGEEMFTGGLRVIDENELKEMLEILQELNPYVIGMEEIMLDDGTFIYSPIYADDYDSVVFTGFIDELVAWAAENNVDINQRDAEQLYLEMNAICDFQYPEFITWHDDGSITNYLYVVLNDGEKVYFGMTIAPSFIPPTGCQLCIRADCYFGNWTSFNANNHIRSCLCCGRAHSLPHIFSWTRVSSTQCSNICLFTTCGHVASTESHSFSNWRTQNAYQCMGTCRCGYSQLSGHTFELMSAGPGGVFVVCRRCSFSTQR